MPHPTQTSATTTSLLRVVALGLVFASLFGAAPAGAHSGKQSYLYLSVFGNEVEGRVEMPIADLARVLDIDIPPETGPAQVALREHRTLIQQYIEEHVAVGAGGVEWDLVYDDEVGFLPLANGSYALFPFEVAETFDTEQRDFTVRFDVIYETDPNRDNLVIIENDWRTATFANEGTPIIGLSTGMADGQIELEAVSAFSSLNALRGLGTDTTRFQSELVFTLIALVIPVGLLSVATRNRTEAPSIAEILRRGRTSLLTFLSCQAIGLWVVSAGSLELGDRLTSTIAAAALFAAAVSILLMWWRPLLGRFLPLVAAVVGAAGGIVAGGAATRLDIDRTRFVLSLLAFHVGLVVVTVVVVAIVGVAMAQLRHSSFAPTIAAVAGASLAGVSAAWILERVAGNSLEINLLTNEPESLWSQLTVLVVLLMTAILVRAYARRTGRQRPIHQSN